MGSDARIHLFDYTAYIEEVVPAFKDYLRTGQAAVWMQGILSAVEDIHTENGSPLLSLPGTDLDLHCTYLRKADLAFTMPNSSEDIWYFEWSRRACTSEFCPDRPICPYHLSPGGRTIEGIHSLFAAVVLKRCLGESQFVGRTMNTGKYDKALNTLGVEAQSPIRDLFWKLGTRGFVVGYQWANSDGIHGWLDPAETRLLTQLLEQLELPRYEASFQKMESFCSNRGYRHPDFSWEALFLSFVRTVGQIAVQRGLGLLWGNDVCPIYED